MAPCSNFSFFKVNGSPETCLIVIEITDQEISELSQESRPIPPLAPVRKILHLMPVDFDEETIRYL